MATITPSEVAIEAASVGRSFGKRQAVANVSFDVRPAEIFGLLGPDGAGKTTLMQLFAAILDPTGGYCRVLGLDSVRSSTAISARIGYMAQGFTLYERLSVDENIAFAAEVRGISGETWQRRRRELLTMAGLTRFTDRRAGQLSGGMRKKLALCTNLIHQPPLLLLDEPSLGVDPLSRHELWDMLRAFRRGGATIVLATSYMDEAEYCDRLAFLDHGRLLAIGSPAELRARAASTVFSITGPSLESAQEELQERSEVIGVQRLSDRIRFQIHPTARLQSDFQDSLARHGIFEPAEATLEDAFMLLAPVEGPSRPNAPLKTITAAPAPIRQASAVRVQGLTCSFGDFVAVEDVSLDVAPGEVLALLGPNGAGKTTFIRAMCGIVRPAAGTAWVAGIDVLREPRRLRSQIGYMSQRFSLYPDLTIGENLFFFAGAYGLGGTRRREEIAWASEMTGLAGLQDQLVRDISGAVRQRLALACSVMHRPLVLFLDEPTSGVDPTSRRRFWRLIHMLAGGGMTIFVTTHNLDEAAYCNRLGLMIQGRLVAIGDLATLKSDLGGEETTTVEDVFLAYIRRDSHTVRNRLAGRSS